MAAVVHASYKASTSKFRNFLSLSFFLRQANELYMYNVADCDYADNSKCSLCFGFFFSRSVSRLVICRNEDWFASLAQMHAAATADVFFLFL